MKERKNSKKERRLYVTALWIELAWPFAVLFAPLSMFITGEWWLLLTLLLLILMPFVGVIMGIQALSDAIKNKNGKGAVLSLIAILAPILVVVFLIAMFSTGVWVIRFM